ncbi:uncharacterized protein LOC131944899 [Physella acuta]|uniref:uncharacterized protein LOC131944899 n=1 Tax=Physella acuta TaxID=109671 RepID=UPI0027DB54E4|nr:uncharacterized protein LOC131944899 [Physella acuta]
MTSQKFELSDLSNSQTNLTNMTEKKNGCYVSSVVGFILILLAAAIAVGVGIIVHFAGGNRDVVCKWDSSVSGASADAIRQECINLAGSGNKDVCERCPAAPTAVPVSTTAPQTTRTTPATKPKVTDVRLPKNVVPSHYNVELQPNMYLPDPANFTFKGSVKIWIKCITASDNVTLHSNVLVIDNSSVKFYPESGTGPGLKSLAIDSARQFFILKLDGNMQPNKTYIIEMNFKSPLKNDLAGLYYSTYNRNGTKVYLATTQFQPTDARKAFPCFDEPAIKATFNITLVRPSHLISISNMPILNSALPFTEDGITYVKDVYQKTPTMSTYLLAFIICDFEYTSNRTKNNILYRTWATKEAVNQTLYALETGVKIITYFEEFFNVSFPLPKQDMIAIPDFAAGAMENWGLITYRETAMLFKPGFSNEANRERVAVVVSHELAHQWFGNLVTPSWWDDLWLNEGFASFVEYLGVNHVHPDWNIYNVLVVSDLQPALQADGLVTSHPVYVPVGHPDEINEIFDSISYSKGCAIIRMMLQFLGEGTFRRGLNRYLLSRQYGAAFHDDLWTALTEQAAIDGKQNINVKTIMDTWTLQMNYPVVKLQRSYNSVTKLLVSQKRYLEDYNAVDPGKYVSPFGYKWNIPITITTSEKPNFSQTDKDVLWLHTNEESKEIDYNPLPYVYNSSGWILANVEMNGFYRVNYADSNWEALCKQLVENHEVIPIINRAQIISDAWNLVKSGDLKLNIALKTIEYLHKEKDYAPWVAARTELLYTSRMLAVTPLFGLFQKFMQEKINSSFRVVGFDNTGSSHTDILARSLIINIACGYGIQSCADFAKDQFKQWMANPTTNPVDPNFRSTVYCSAISSGGWDEWSFGLKMYTESDLASEKVNLLSALSCTKQPWILNNFLSLVVEKDSVIRKQDALNVITYISSNTVGRSLAWNFFRANFQHLKDTFGASFFSWSNVIDAITRNYNTEFELSEVKAFYASQEGKFGSGERAMQQGIEKISSNIKWMETNRGVLKTWLDDVTSQAHPDMPSQKFELSDLSNSQTNLTNMTEKKNGCYVSSVFGFILILLAAAIAVGVGIIVHFVGGNKVVVCKFDSSVGTASAIWRECISLSSSGNKDVCGRCPASPTTNLPMSTPSPSTLTTPATKPKVTDVRLPKNVVPLHYNVELQPNMYLPDPANFTFKGSVKIWIKCITASDNVTLHFNILEIDNSSVRFYPESGTGPSIKSLAIDSDRQFFILKLDGNMLADKTYILEMTFESPLKNDLNGLYYSSYNRNGSLVYLASTLFAPTDARKAFPCFDEPAIKATFNVTLVRSSHLISLSNMPVLSNSASYDENGVTYIKDVYQQTPLMSTYLLAFIICDFEYTFNTTKNNILYRAWAAKEAINQTTYALETGIKIITYFEEFFNVSFPLPKQDMIAIPDFAAGAMENWGLITYRETAMLYKPGISNEDNLERVAVVVSHELAHQWFGNLVTPSWWDDLWLNEGFASFVEYLGVNHVHPDWNIYNVLVVSDLQPALQADGLVTSHPVYVPVGHPDEINEIFDSISYSKGCAIIRMMLHFLGEGTFRRGLNRYLLSRQYGAAFHDDLWTALTEQAAIDGKQNINVKTIMDTWTLQMNYPVVKLQRSYNSVTKLLVSQKRYLEDYNAVDPGKYVSPFGYKWNIPITITTSEKPNFSQTDKDVLWLHTHEESKEIDYDPLPSGYNSSGWILANVEMNGFYKVNYADSNWEALCKQLVEDHKVIPIINRAQIISDAWSLVKSGDLKLNIALKTIEYLHKEKDYAPWVAARTELLYTSRMLAVTPLFGLFQKFMQEKINSSFQVVGFDNTGSSHTDILARSLIINIACGYGIQKCADFAKDQFKQWMANPTSNTVDPNFRSTVYCSAISSGGWDEWSFGLKMYTESDLASEKVNLLSALSCTKQPWILNNFLSLVIEKDSVIRKQDTLNVITYISSNTVGRSLAWNFFRANFQHLKDIFGASFFSWSNVIDAITRNYNTEFELSEVKAFYASQEGKFGSGERAIQQGIEKIASNIKWLETNRDVLRTWLEDVTSQTVFKNCPRILIPEDAVIFSTYIYTKYNLSNSQTNLTNMTEKKNGCYVSSVVGFILILLAAAIAVGVGIIVHFAGGNKVVVCKFDSSFGTASDIWKECISLSSSGNKDVCGRCPASPTTNVPMSTPSPSTLTTPATKPKVTNVRLPKNVVPLHYNVELHPNMYLPDPANFTFKGSVKIWIKCITASDNVTLHFNVLEINNSSVRFYPESGTGPGLKSLAIDPDRQFFITKLDGNMQANKTYILEMTFKSPLKNDLHGLYYSSYNRNGSLVYIASTLFSPTDARKAFPCFDEPAIKATFNVTLVRPSHLISLSNMPVLSNSASYIEDGITYIKDVYQQTPKMSTYLLAFIICDFEYTFNTTKNNILYRVWAAKAAINQTAYALETGIKIITYFEEFFNVSFPLPKQDMIAIPDFAAGAMENWGLITYRETAMLYKPGVSNEGNLERVAVVVSHELAHQWFGNLVTPSWWDDLWLKEGFASFVEYLGVNHVHPDWNIFNMLVVRDLQPALESDGLVTSHPVYVPVGHPDEINEIFDSISYSKGCAIIRMMLHFLGEGTFRRGLNRYLTNLKFDAAYHDDLWTALTEQALIDGKQGIDVKTIMDTWTLQMNYPVVTVLRSNVSVTKLLVSQKRYLEDYNAVDPGKYVSPFGYKWNIPITITSSENPNFNQTDRDVLWLHAHEERKQIDYSPLPKAYNTNGWILANVEMNGFYRVNYADSNWEALCKQLVNDHIVFPVINRAQIINDAWNLVKSGDLKLNIALKTIEYLHKEKDYAPWVAARTELLYTSRMLAVTPLFGLFQKFMQDKINSSFQYFGFNNTGSSHTEILARSLNVNIACSYGIQACLDAAQAQYKQWMSNPTTNNIDPNFRTTVYCNAIANGGWDEWNFGLKMYTESDLASEKYNLLVALSCTRQPWILNYYMSLIFEKNSVIRNQDSSKVILLAATNTVGRSLAWNFFRANFQKLKDKFGGSFFAWPALIDYVTSDFNTEFELSEVKAFKASQEGKFGSGERAMQQGIEKISSNIKWMETNRGVLKTWLEDVTSHHTG